VIYCEIHLLDLSVVTGEYNPEYFIQPDLRIPILLLFLIGLVRGIEIGDRGTNFLFLYEEFIEEPAYMAKNLSRDWL
jgi:hypothetical protein